MEFWFRRKFNLAPTDPRFLDATREAIETEYWAHWFADNPAKVEDADDEFDLAAETARIEREAEEPDVKDWVDI